MLRIGIILTATGFIALVYGLLAGTGHMPGQLTGRGHLPPRSSMIVGLVLIVVGVALLVVGLV